MSMFLLGLCSSADDAAALAASCGGRAWSAEAKTVAEAPYQAMFELAGDDIERASTIADRGLYVVFRRTIKQLDAAGGPGLGDRAIASFGMVRHPDRTHTESDVHWRDTHGPLALRCHEAMSDYEQLSVVATISGPPLDGMAMCAFPDRETLSTRFFNDDDAKAEVFADVASFADPRNSLPRVVLHQSV